MALEFFKFLQENSDTFISILILLVLNYYMYKHFTKVIKDKNSLIEEKDKALLGQATKVIELATLWEVKSNDNTDAINKTHGLLIEIKEALIASNIMKP